MDVTLLRTMAPSSYSVSCLSQLVSQVRAKRSIIFIKEDQARSRDRVFLRIGTETYLTSFSTIPFTCTGHYKTMLLKSYTCGSYLTQSHLNIFCTASGTAFSDFWSRARMLLLSSGHYLRFRRHCPSSSIPYHSFYCGCCTSLVPLRKPQDFPSLPVTRDLDMPSPRGGRGPSDAWLLVVPRRRLGKLPGCSGGNGLPEAPMSSSGGRAASRILVRWPAVRRKFADGRVGGSPSTAVAVRDP